jgi:antitoxin component YwqK of YwqJK toxin-antitoxin module
MRGRSEYDHGKDTGTFIYWDENGQERKEYESVDGLKHGRYTEWDENGEIFETGEYLRGRKHGTWLNREADGRVVETHWVQGTQQPATTRP